jgi:hypothetical protein
MNWIGPSRSAADSPIRVGPFEPNETLREIYCQTQTDTVLYSVCAEYWVGGVIAPVVP